MIHQQKIYILLPDGVGLRNFAFSSFVEIGERMGWEVVFWNQTLFDLKELGFQEIKLKGKPRAMTDLLKRARINVSLDHFEEIFQDPVYQTYKFPPTRKDLKSKVKNALVDQMTTTYRGEKGLEKLRFKLKESERKSFFYHHCKEVLENEKPDFVFCTNQRPVNAIAPLTAAEDLGIPTATFIFSWDNLPKATMVVEPKYYFVWSTHMKEELLSYYPFIEEKQIVISGSPQFEPHFNPSLRISREAFFKEHNLDLTKEYICYSGDDITTSPDDPQYLNDVAEAVEKLNKSRKHNLGIIFRRCPVDFSDRYFKVLEKFRGLIVPISPEWKQIDNTWNAILPTIEDLKLQINTIFHTKAVVNLGSSMVFDFAAFNKPCLFINYDVVEKINKDWSTKKIYDFKHFSSMPTGKEVIWLNSKEDIGEKLENTLIRSSDTVVFANEWFKKINVPPAVDSSERIWKAIENIFNKCT